MALPRLTLVLAASLVALAPAGAATLTPVTDFGSNPGNLAMSVYVPTSLATPAPLVLLMHGCSQGPSDYDDETGWVKYADAWGFILVFAEQRASNNYSQCFNWFEAGDYARDSGEALSLMQMVQRAEAEWDVDAGRIFVSGLSSGGAMTAVMLAVYPDVFAGGAIMAGVPYRCATGYMEAWSCMDAPTAHSPAEWGDLVRGASTHDGPWPRVSIWHGTLDDTVAFANAAASVAQWTDVHGLSQTPTRQETAGIVTHRYFEDAAGATLVEEHALAGMGHGVPIDPGAGADECGTVTSYMRDVDLCSTYVIASAWGLEPIEEEPDDDGAPSDDGAPDDGAPGDDGAPADDDPSGSDADGGDGGPDLGADEAADEGQGCAGAAGSWLGVLATLMAASARRRRR